MKRLVLSLALLIFLFGLMVSKTSSSPKFIIEKIDKDFSDLMGGTSGGISVTVKNTGDSTGNVYVVVVPDSDNVQVVPKESVGTIGAGQEATFNFQVSAANVDLKDTPINIYVKDYFGYVYDSYTLYINIYAIKGMVEINMAYFEPGTVHPPAETDLIVRLTSTAPQRLTLTLSDYDKNIFSFDSETKSVDIQNASVHEIRFHAKVKPFSDKTYVKVNVYDDHNTRLGIRIVELYYGNPPPMEQPMAFDWNLIGYSLLVVVIIVLFISTIYFWLKSRR